MSKYNIYATREDWDRLYVVVEKKLGKEEVKSYRKMQSMDNAVTRYTCETKDYKLADLKNNVWCECVESEKEKCFENASYRNDNECECGIAKHHYHGSICKKVVQIG